MYASFNMYCTINYVFPDDLDVIVMVATGLFMVEAGSVEKLNVVVNTTITVQRHSLDITLTTNVWVASVSSSDTDNWLVLNNYYKNTSTHSLMNQYFNQFIMYTVSLLEDLTYQTACELCQNTTHEMDMEEKHWNIKWRQCYHFTLFNITWVSV